MTDEIGFTDLIHRSSLELLWSPGVRLRNEEVLELLKKGGARVEGDMIMFSGEDVMESLARAPETFTLHAVNSDRAISIGGNSRCMAGSFGAPTIVTSDHRRRPATFDDYIRVARLVHASDRIHINGGALVQPADLEPGTDRLMMIRAALAITDKPLLGIQGDYEDVARLMELCRIARGGEARFTVSSHILFLVNTSSPLQIDRQALGTILACARFHQPLVITPAPMAGCTGPITTEGSLVLANTEFLAALCVAQKLRPGLPVVYGCLSSQGDMRSGAPRIASPNRAAFMRLAARMAEKYHLPCRGQGVAADAGQLSFQSAYEAVFTLSYTYINRTSLTIHAAGILDSFGAFSYEQFMLDLEMIRMMDRAHREFTFSEDAMALDVIRRVGPGGEFLSDDHTLEHCRTEPYISSLAPEGGDDPRQYLADLDSKLKKSLAILEQSYKKPDLDESLQREMDAHLADLDIPAELIQKAGGA